MYFNIVLSIFKFYMISICRHSFLYCNVYPLHRSTVAQRFIQWCKHLSLLERYPKKRGPTFQKQLSDFMETSNKLFHIF